MSAPQTAWGCLTSVVASLATLAAVCFGVPPALTALIRWQGVADSQSPEALAILTLMVLGPLLFPLVIIVAGLAGAYAGLLVDRYRASK